MASASELASTQAELQSVKRALQSGAAYLGLQGEALQKYLLQLSEKENLLLSKQLHSMAAQDSFEPLLPATASSGPTRGYAAGHVTNGAHQPARPAPVGDAKAFNRENLQDVLTHMAEYEAVPAECAKALKALSSLAYSNARSVGKDERVLAALLRAVRLHQSEGAVQLTAMRAISNMAYDQEVALTRLAKSDVMGQLLTSMASKSEPKEIAARASEALARIIAAEVKPDSEGGGPPPEQPVQVPPGSPGALCGLFLAACSAEAPCKEIVPQLLLQLSSNEVIEAKQAAEGFTRCEQECKTPADGVGWLALAKVLSPMDSVRDLPAALVEAGAIRAAASIMTRFIEDRLVQLTGIEAMSSLVGNRWAGLRAFADVGGMERVEEAMRRHGQDSMIQTKGVRALGSGVQWPQDIQERARYSHRRAVDLTKTAMSQHGADVELQIAALEALAKYLDKTKCVSDIKDAGGEGLVKMMMTTHHSNAKVQQWGRHVLTGIGADPNWAPKAGALP
ncbi:unnamed protein product [Durusdinium trenchii]|uniref:Uncharacterized protein n=2 Tax=Durusdinium trenchii TaxID=1381693 RepID=A0ABP0L8V7_9DINO